MEHLEGRQSIFAALEARQRKIEVILLAHGAHVEKLSELLGRAAELNVPVRHVDRQELDALAHGSTHGGVVAVCSAKPRLRERALLELVEASPGASLLLLLEGIEDARNLGFTIRTAEALGAQAVLVKKHLWDLDAIEIARPSAGAFERLPLAQIEDVAPLLTLRRRGLQLIGCIAGARRTLYDIDWTLPSIIAIGGEKRGLSGAVREICDQFVTIPTQTPGASLSLSHAATVVLAEAARQRSASTKPASTERGQ